MGPVSLTWVIVVLFSRQQSQRPKLCLAQNIFLILRLHWGRKDVLATPVCIHKPSHLGWSCPCPNHILLTLVFMWSWVHFLPSNQTFPLFCPQSPSHHKKGSHWTSFVDLSGTAAVFFSEQQQRKQDGSVGWWGGGGLEPLLPPLRHRKSLCHLLHCSSRCKD